MDNARNEVYQIPALSVDPKVGIALSASETDDYFSYLLFEKKNNYSFFF